MIPSRIKSKKISYKRHSRAKMHELSLTTKDIEAIRDNGCIRKEIKGKLEVSLGKKGKALVAIFQEYPNEIIFVTVWRE